MLKYDNYEIVKMHICSFEGKDGVLSFDIDKYPERLCVCDKSNKLVIDVETLHQYPYISGLNMQSFYDISNAETFSVGNRIGCIEYATCPYELENESLEMCINIIEQLKLGQIFPDGNSILTNEEYLLIAKVSETGEKIKKIGTKRK